MSMNNMASRQTGNVVIGGQVYSSQQVGRSPGQQFGMGGPPQRVVQQHVGPQMMQVDDQERQRAAQQQLRKQLEQQAKKKVLA